MAQGVSELVGGGKKNLRKIELKSSSLKDKSLAHITDCTFRALISIKGLMSPRVERKG
jgi:hypothetical protein